MLLFLLLYFTKNSHIIITAKRGDFMPNIKPVSDLRNYNEVLRDVAVGDPVFLTKNGRGRYAIVDMAEYEKTQATIKLMSELARGRKSGEEQGWHSHEDVRARFKEKINE
jgi:prevent-host-death family protein